MNKWFSRIPQKYWAYLALSVWGVICFVLLNKTSYGLDEGAARALLLVWSVSDDVVSPIVTLGLPDFRTVFLAPMGFLWTGNVLAAKITTIFVMAVAAWVLYAWRKHSNEDSEAVLLATGLLLISPLVLDQIDTVAVAPYLLIIFTFGAWADKLYREAPLVFGGMYFGQLFLCLVSVTLHPLGLAYPLALLWKWYKTPIDKQQNYFFGGIIFTVLLALALTLGWNHIGWFTSPIKGLSSVFLGFVDGDEVGTLRWFVAIGMLLILLSVVWTQARNLWGDFLGRILLCALIIGLFISDATFSLVALTICLYWGLPLLLEKGTNSQGGFWKQRGVILFGIMVVSTIFMMVDKGHYQKLQTDFLSPRDSLIKTLAENSINFSENESAKKLPDKKSVRIASQWPGLTTLACRCDVLPLPPSAKDSEALLAMLRGINYLIFDPRDPVNSSLSRNLAVTDTGRIETIALQSGGVIVEVKHASTIEQKL